MNKRANYEIIGLFVFLIGILLGYMTAFGTGATTTSRVVSAGTGTLCFDSDGGYNIYTYGYVTYNSKTYKDSCFSESKLYERGCVNDKHYTKRYDCQYGCSGGACICIDSDSDGYTASWCGGNDCDDSNPLISQGLKETCSDGLDNDCDGLIDDDDPDCRITIYQCNDGIDNDGDGKIDMTQYSNGVLIYSGDRGCNSINDNTEQDQCDDGIDNDGDTYTDYPADGGCVGYGDIDEYNAPPSPGNGNTTG